MKDTIIVCTFIVSVAACVIAGQVSKASVAKACVKFAKETGRKVEFNG